MTIPIRTLLNMSGLPVGRQLFALNSMQPIAEDLEVPRVTQWVEQAIEDGKRARDLETRWRGSRNQPQHGRRAGEFDAQLDMALSGLDDQLSAISKTFDPEDPVVSQAQTLREGLFPNGVYPITSLPYVEQHETVVVLLERAEREPLRTIAQALGMGSTIERIRVLNERYGDELGGDAAELSFEQIREARERCQDNLMRVVALVVATFPGDSSEHEDARRRLLQPILEQNEAVRRARRRRRTVTDVDPDSGAEETQSEETQSEETHAEETHAEEPAAEEPAAEEPAAEGSRDRVGTGRL